MTPLYRLRGTAAALAIALQAIAASSWAQAPSAPVTAEPPPDENDQKSINSPLTAELFYQLLLGELNARGEDPGAGYSLVLDAARRTNDPALYRRAVEIAFQARAGDAALQAARAWRQAQPTSREANRFVLQILLALNRPSEVLEPLRSEIALTPPSERSATISAIPRLFARASDKKQAATLVEQALADAVARPETAAAAWTAIGRTRMAAADNNGALAAAQRAQAADAQAEGPALLALELLDARVQAAEPLVRKYLESPRARTEIRMAYARGLLDAQRLQDASQQLSLITRERPDFAEAWLVQGVLDVQRDRLDAGETALKRYLDLAQQAGTADERSRGLAQAYLSLSQIAEKRKDMALAGAWLDKIDDPQELATIQARKALLLARQGKLDEGRRLLRALPERSPAEARTKLMAEVQLLRDTRQYKPAYELLAHASEKNPQDAELLYDQAMVAEKLGDLGGMERLLRRAVSIKPDFYHAYNALGYSLADRNLRLPEARELVKKALEFAPGDPFITDSLAWVEYRMGNKAEALRLLDGAYKQRPDSEIAAHLGEVLWSMGQRDRAVAIWREGLLLNRENETLQETLKRLQVKL